MGDEYFTRLYGLRNEEAKKIRNGTSDKDEESVKTKQSNEGCESVNNDMRRTPGRQMSCESLSNQA